MTQYKLDDRIVFQPDEAVLAVDGTRHKLEPRLCGLLSLLVQKDGEAVSRDEILETVWDEGVSDHALTQAISRLRAICAPHPVIETVPRIGYRLSRVPVLMVEPVTFPASPQAHSGGRPRISRRHVWWIAAGSVVAVAVLAVIVLGVPDPVRSIWCGACLPSD